MSAQVITEPGYTNFSLTYLAVTGNARPAEDLKSGDMTVPGALACILVPHILCTLFIIARAYSRIAILRKWFLDDTLILLAWAISTAVCIVYSIITALSGSHLNYLNRDKNNNSTSAIVTSLSTGAYIALILYQFTHLVIKLSTLSLYYRIFSSSSEGPRKASPAERTLTRLTALAVVLYIIPLLALTIMQCHRDLSSVQDRCAASGASVPFKTLLITSAALHAATDVWLIALILPCVVRLRVLPRRNKAVLGGVLSLGVFVVAAGMARLAVSLRLVAAGGSGGSPPAESPAFFVVTVLELDVAVVCASAPTLRPLLARGWPRRWGDKAPLGRLLPKRGGVRGDERGVSLTSVVRCYEQQPWLRDPGSSLLPGTPPAGEWAKGGSAVRVGAVQVPHVSPPPPVRATPRAPTMLSLRSFVKGMRPSSATTRSRGRMDWEDRTQLLGEEFSGRDGTTWKRRSSVGLEVYYELLIGYGDGEKRGNQGAARAAVRHSLDSRRSSAGSGYAGGWGDSQESLVLGMNDPNSPTRRNPVSRLGELTRADAKTRDPGDDGGSRGRDDGAVRDWQEQGNLMIHRSRHPNKWDG